MREIVFEQSGCVQGIGIYDYAGDSCMGEQNNFEGVYDALCLGIMRIDALFSENAAFRDLKIIAYGPKSESAEFQFWMKARIGIYGYEHQIISLHAKTPNAVGYWRGRERSRRCNPDYKPV
jgi:hypothetical protein